MFACLEVDTEDTEVWNKIDKVICDTFGMSHILWGVSEKKSDPIPSKVPSNLYITESSVGTAAKFRDTFKKAVEEVWSGTYRFVIIDVNTWASDQRSAGKITNINTITDTDEITNREE